MTLDSTEAVAGLNLGANNNKAKKKACPHEPAHNINGQPPANMQCPRSLAAKTLNLSLSLSLSWCLKCVSTGINESLCAHVYTRVDQILWQPATLKYFCNKCTTSVY